ncbi:MAG: hypothetical protein JW852_07825 [Spirochaetales bacterium]|nr:hypothetical protein [Spirochaetales bacterium]
MESIESILEQELEGAVDIRDKKFLRRYIALMTRSFVIREEHMTEIGSLRSDIQVLAESMKQGFERIDRRFEAVDKRFDDVNRRFDDVNKRFDDVNKRFVMMFSFITIGFVVLSTLVTLYQFLG